MDHGMIATHCYVCGRQLTDATSIEYGIGPVCRNKHGYGDAYPLTAEMIWAVSGLLEAAGLNDLLDQVAKAPRHLTDDGQVSTRTMANALVYRLSARHPLQADDAQALAMLQALWIMGYRALAQAGVEALVGVVITEDDAGRLAVRTPYEPAFVERVRALPSRRWDREAKVNTVARADSRGLLEALRASFAGMVALGPKGIFTV